MNQLHLFQRESQGRCNAAEPKDQVRFEELRLELVNYLLEKMGVKRRVTVLDQETVARLRRQLRRRGGPASQFSFLAFVLYDALAMKCWSKFTSAHLEQHMQHIKDVVAIQHMR